MNLLAVATVSSVSFAPGEGRAPAIIQYTLSDAPAIITADIQTNTVADGSGEWASIGGAAMGELQGDASCIVWKDGVKTATWLPGEYWPNTALPAAQMRVVVRAWETNSPPDYLVVNLTGPTNVVRFYERESLLPGGVTNVCYRTTKLAMRKIPAAGVVWRMGSPVTEKNRLENEVPHLVMLTEDFYCGIFPVTAGQYAILHKDGSSGSTFTSYADYRLRPSNALRLDGVRGIDEATAKANPATHTVGANSPIDRARKQTGFPTLDVPFEAQWEYACRAGVGTALYDGNDFSGTVNTDKKRTAALGWSNYNASSQPHPVGLKTPNNWGLYDMLGNVYELCLDMCDSSGSVSTLYTATFTPGWDDADSPSVTTNPVGVTGAQTNVGWVRRGGSWYVNYDNCRCARRYPPSSYTPTGSSNTYGGCRLFCPVTDVVR